VTYVVIGIKHTSDVLCQVAITDSLHVVTAVDCSHTHMQMQCTSISSSIQLGNTLLGVRHQEEEEERWVQRIWGTSFPSEV